MVKPTTVAVTHTELGQWIPFDEGVHNVVHAIQFSDGSVWDAKNGWRNIKDRYPETPFEDRPSESITRFVRCELDIDNGTDIVFVFETVTYEYNTAQTPTTLHRYSLANFIDYRR